MKDLPCSKCSYNELPFSQRNLFNVISVTNEDIVVIGYVPEKNYYIQLIQSLMWSNIKETSIT